MRIGDLIIIISEPKEMDDKFLGKYYNAFVKTVRGQFSTATNVNLFFPPNSVAPTKYSFEKGKKNPVTEMPAGSVWQIADIDISGSTYNNEVRTYIRIFAVPREKNFVKNYVKRAIEMDDKGEDFAKDMGWTNLDKDTGEENSVRPFVFWKFIKIMHKNIIEMPTIEPIIQGLKDEIKLADEVSKELITRNEFLEKEVKRLEQQALVAGTINIFTKKGTIKKRYLKDMGV